MALKSAVNSVLKTAKHHEPQILTTLGISGVLTTSYLVGKAAFQASEVTSRMKHPEDASTFDRVKVQAKETWRLYVPAVISGGATIGCILGASRSNTKRAAAAATAYSVAEMALVEYREKVAEVLGVGKEQKLRDEIVQQKVDADTDKNVIILGNASAVLCCELYTGRYFRSDMETLRKAQNDTNAKIYSERYVSLTEFYDLLGLPTTTASSDMGWDSDRLMELEFSAVITDGEPCLAFNYNYVKPL